MVNAKAGAAISGSAGDRHHLAPIPRQEFSQVSDLMIGDPGQHVSEPGLRIDAVELGRLNERQHDRCALTAAIGAGEQPRLSAESNLAAILPMSGRMLWSDIAGIRCTDRGCVVFRASSAHRVSWYMWS